MLRACILHESSGSSKAIGQDCQPGDSLSFSVSKDEALQLVFVVSFDEDGYPAFSLVDLRPDESA